MRGSASLQGVIEYAIFSSMENVCFGCVGPTMINIGGSQTSLGVRAGADAAIGYAVSGGEIKLAGGVTLGNYPVLVEPGYQHRQRDHITTQMGRERARQRPFPARFLEPAASVSRPLHQRRHRGEDRGDVAAGLQAEDRAAVVDQVELDIAPAADELFLALGFLPWREEIAPHQPRVDIEEGEADVAGEGEVGLPVARVQPVVEDAADAARLVAVLEEEVLVAPLLVAVVVGADGRRRPPSWRRGSRPCPGRPGSAAHREPASGRRRRRTSRDWSPPAACSCGRLARAGSAGGRSAKPRSRRNAGPPQHE